MLVHRYGLLRSHAQKYFLKVQKNGTGAHVPPPRPKRKAAHPYPQKSSKNDNKRSRGATGVDNCHSSSTESPPGSQPNYEENDKANQIPSHNGIPMYHPYRSSIRPVHTTHTEWYAVRPCTAQYIPVRQLTGMQTDRYRAILLKSAIDNRFRPSGIDFDRRLKKKRRKEEEKKKEEVLVAILACTLPVRPRRLRVDREPSLPSLPVGHPPDVAALVARGRLSSPRGETKRWYQYRQNIGMPVRTDK
ncbi:hypothetical protein B296_00057983 [Ensete ventricosum]|uniref:HTH myb-type domain-containing protein n=1 Tax=Ensete ventricosum TaxID=4639 RepID=A0A426XNY8_ENSVE|nr:hypothetical protein B296_00057983 [Ensete ventricosum]